MRESGIPSRVFQCLEARKRHTGTTAALCLAEQHDQLVSKRLVVDFPPHHFQQPGSLKRGRAEAAFRLLLPRIRVQTGQLAAVFPPPSRPCPALSLLLGGSLAATHLCPSAAISILSLSRPFAPRHCCGRRCSICSSECAVFHRRRVATRPPQPTPWTTTTPSRLTNRTLGRKIFHAHPNASAPACEKPEFSPR